MQKVWKKESFNSARNYVQPRFRTTQLDVVKTKMGDMTSELQSASKCEG